MTAMGPRAPHTFRRVNAPQLDRRERDLLRLWAEGSTDQEAADRLGLSLRTVGRLSAAIMDRMGARSRFQAGWLAARNGWLG